MRKIKSLGQKDQYPISAQKHKQEQEDTVRRIAALKTYPILVCIEES